MQNRLLHLIYSLEILLIRIVCMSIIFPKKKKPKLLFCNLILHLRDNNKYKSKELFIYLFSLRSTLKDVAS